MIQCVFKSVVLKNGQWYNVTGDFMSKARIIRLLKILQENTNPNHILNTEQIIPMLAEYGEDAERKTLYSDIRTLNELGYNVETVHIGSSTGYYYDSQPFDNAELRILAEGIVANNYVTDRKTDKIMDKLLGLTDKYDRKMISETMKYRHAKTTNEEILYNIDALQQAIYERKAISFRYFDYTIDHQKKYRKKGAEYHSIPYALVSDNERFYLIGYSEKYHNFSHYRLDRMERIETSDTDHQYVSFDVNRYMSQTFQMYSGELTNVTLKFHEKLASEFLDKFSEGMIIQKKEGDMITANVRIYESVVFYSWIFMYGNQVEIISPDSIREKFRQLCYDCLDRYKGENYEV